MKRFMYLALALPLLVSGLLITSNASAVVAVCRNDIPEGGLSRYYVPETSGHFYTASYEESTAVSQNPRYKPEGTMGVSTCFPNGSAIVHRFYNLRNGTHFYTINETEAEKIRTTMSNIYRYEGGAFYAFPERITNLRACCTSPTVHRFYDFKRDVHFYTTNQAEATYINDHMFSKYRYEGEAFYMDVGHQP